MSRFLLGLLTVILTIALLLGGGLLLAKQEKPSQSIPEVPETTHPIAETTLTPETEEAQ